MLQHHERMLFWETLFLLFTFGPSWLHFSYKQFHLRAAFQVMLTITVENDCLNQSSPMTSYYSWVSVNKEMCQLKHKRWREDSYYCHATVKTLSRFSINFKHCNYRTETFDSATVFCWWWWHICVFCFSFPLDSQVTQAIFEFAVQPRRKWNSWSPSFPPKYWYYRCVQFCLVY